MDTNGIGNAMEKANELNGENNWKNLEFRKGASQTPRKKCRMELPPSNVSKNSSSTIGMQWQSQDQLTMDISGIGNARDKLHELNGMNLAQVEMYIKVSFNNTLFAATDKWDTLDSSVNLASCTPPHS
jgi:hypothetical protein